MMKCTDFKNQIDEYCRAELSPELMADSKAHLESCSECSKAVGDHNSLLASLKAMPIPGPSRGFAERALRVAIDQGMEQGAIGQNNHHRRGFMVGFGSAAVAGLALWVVSISPQLIPGDTGALEMAKAGTEEVGTVTNVETNADTNVTKNIPEFSIALNEQRDIKLAFFSSEDLKGATITLQMPENVALVGYEGQRKLVWETNLAKGDNTLRLPVIATSVATSKTGGQLVAHIEYMGKVKTLKVNLAIDTINAVPEMSGSTRFEMRVV
jgi:hypothetical protein